jgi:DNA polymerase (family 10)
MGYLSRVSDLKADILDMLREMEELTTLDEGDPASFRVRAYENATRAVEAYPGDPSSLTVAQLQKIEGIGKATAAKIRELVDTGRVTRLDELRAKHPASLVALLHVQGLGPKNVNRLRAELGVLSIDDLKKAVAEHKLRGLKGFGEKSEEKLAHTLERIVGEGGEKRTPISVALPVAERVVERMLAVPGVKRAAYCGSLRRFSETIGDVDVVVAADDAGPVMDALVGMSFVDQVLGRGDTKTSVITRRGLQIDLRVVAEEQIGAALLYFTGSKSHNVKLRQRALARGMTLNEYALTEVETGKIVAAATEESIYEALGLPWIPPCLREDVGELEAADRGALPAQIERAQVRGDFHLHTNVSGDGRSSLEEMVAAAIAGGVEVLAVTEHAENTVAGVPREALVEQRRHIAAMRDKVGDKLTLLHGVELNIGPKGELDYDDAFRRELDWCLASVHDHFELDRAAQTKRVITAMRDPSVRMIGHLTARMIGARPPIDLDLDAVFAAAEETGVALEINGGLPRLDVSVDILRRAKGRNVTFVLSSDAHHTSEIDRLSYAALNAAKAWIPPERIANLWPREKLAAWATQKRA